MCASAHREALGRPRAEQCKATELGRRKSRPARQSCGQVGSCHACEKLGPLDTTELADACTPAVHRGLARQFADLAELFSAVRSIGWAASAQAGDPDLDHQAMLHQLEARMLCSFARALLNSSALVAGFSGVVAIFALYFVPVGPLIAWLGLQALLLGLGRRLATKLLDQPDARVRPAYWGLWFGGLEIARGIAWGALAGGVAATSDHSTAGAFGLMTMVSASALAATIGASSPGSIAGAMILMAATVLLGLLEAGPGIATVLLAALACYAQLYLLGIAYKLHATALKTSSIQKEKDDLIAELESARAASDLARRRAEDANFAKSRFLAAMSHELRTPLNAILGFSEVMKGELFGAHSVASYREYSNDIHASGQHLLVLINEILDLSRIEAGRFELKEDVVRLSSVVADCKHLLDLRAKGRSISIETSAEPDLPPLRADERAIRQMVLNLLSNAISFSPPGGQIKFKIGWTGRGGQYFSVRDSGPGIPEKEIPTILTPFGRGTLAQECGEQGTGLGLAIVKGLAELHGGTFLLRSKLLEGTEVAVIFPPGRVRLPTPDLGRDESNAAAGGGIGRGARDIVETRSAAGSSP